jgi:asparagine synthase (glutamine-hydrolysing)
VRHFDEPFADASAVPTSRVAQVASRAVKVCLSGDGGDEGFAGYEAYTQAERFARADRVPLAIRRALLGPLERRWPEWRPGKGALRFLTLPAADRYVELMGSIDHSTRPWLLTRDFERAAGRDPYDPIRARYAALGRYDEVARLQRLDVETYLPDDILVKADRTSMLHSLELRVPLLDHKVLELAFRMPTALKRRGGRGKAILRDTFADRLPAGILARGKQGFGIPAHAPARSLRAGRPRSAARLVDARRPRSRERDLDRAGARAVVPRGGRPAGHGTGPGRVVTSPPRVGLARA